MHFTWWCLEVGHVVKHFAFSALIDDIVVGARQADAVGHVFGLTCEEKLRRTQSPVISLEWEVAEVPLRRSGVVPGLVLPDTDNRFILHLRLSLGCIYVEFCCEHQVAGHEILPRLGVYKHHIDHLRQVFEAEVTLYPSRHVLVLDVLDAGVQAFLREHFLPFLEGHLNFG